MTNAELITTIRNEIIRLKGQLIRGACAAQIEMETNCKEKAYDDVLSFLSTLEPELTIKDLELLHVFLYAVKNNKQGVFTFTRLSDEQYEEVLKRFKEAKK